MFNPGQYRSSEKVINNFCFVSENIIFSNLKQTWPLKKMHISCTGPEVSRLSIGQAMQLHHSLSNELSE